jgi:Lar family restriction alleviation protein
MKEIVSNKRESFDNIKDNWQEGDVLEEYNRCTSNWEDLECSPFEISEGYGIGAEIRIMRMDEEFDPKIPDDPREQLKVLREAVKELKPCPFCGCVDYLNILPQSNSAGEFYMVTCIDCGVKMVPIVTNYTSQIVAQWNRRNG